MPVEGEGRDPSSLEESLFAEYLARASAGDPADFEAFAAEHSEHATGLRRLLSGWVNMQAVAAVAGFPGSSAEREEGHQGTPRPAAVPPRLTALLQRLAANSARGSRYIVGGSIGRGGMGEVREAVDRDLGRSLAVKRMREDRLQAGADLGQAEPMLMRFMEEAQITAQLDHPGVVPVHEIGVDAEGRPFIAMARVAGESLQPVFAKSRRGAEGWSIPRALSVLVRVCETMEYAHARGVVHRDLKPSNVMVGSFGEVYVVDWGLARVLAGSGSPGADVTVKTERGRLLADEPGSPLATDDQRQPGTPVYMSPEQAGGHGAEIGPSTDIYAVGAMLYELLSGQPPYHHGAAPRSRDEQLRRVAETGPEPLSSVAPEAPLELVAICERAMARRPEERFASMGGLAEDLRAFLEGRVVRSFEMGAWPTARKWIGRNRRLASALAAAIMFLVVGLAVSLAATARAGEERDRAGVAEGESHRLLLDNNQRLIELAGERGQWHEVLDLLDAAQRESKADRTALDVQRARALIALSRRDEAQSLVEELHGREDLGERRGALLLMEADIAASDWDSREKMLGIVRSALDTQLNQADREYALGLVAEKTPEALDHFQHALELDPFHHAALSYAINLLTFSGRYDEALELAKVMKAFYPEDPAPYAAMAFVHALQANTAAADESLAQLGLLTSPTGLDAVRAFVQLVPKAVRSGSSDFWLGGGGTGSLAPQLMAAMALLPMIQKPSGLHDTGMIAINLPSLGGAWGKAFDGIFLLAGIQPGDSAGLQHNAISVLAKFSHSKPPSQEDLLGAQQLFHEAWELHPDGLFLYMEACCWMQTHGNVETRRMQHMRVAEGLWREAASAPSILMGVQRAARYWATLAAGNVIVGSGQPEPEMRADAALHLHWFSAQESVTGGEAPRLLDTAQGLGLYDLAFGIADVWERSAAPDTLMRLTRLELEIRAGRYESAVAVADRLLEAEPENERARELRGKAILRAQAWADSQE